MGYGFKPLCIEEFSKTGKNFLLFLTHGQNFLQISCKFLANFFHFYFAVVAVVADVAVVVVSVTVAVGHLQIFLIGRNFFFKLYFSIF